MKAFYLILAFFLSSSYTFSQIDHPTSSLRWSFQDPAAIGGNLMVSKDGRYTSVGWDLNNKRICLYGNISSTPFWTYTAASTTNSCYTAISDTGGYIAGTTATSINLFTNNSNVPILSYSLTGYPSGTSAGPVVLTSNGKYFVSSVNRSDTTQILGFNKDSASYIWRYSIYKPVYGINISKNDSLVIVSTYNNFYVFNTFTGDLRFTDTIRFGNQMKYGISGNGNILAAIDYRGYLKVYEWNGSTYIVKWTFQEPTGTYYNWIVSVDISYDGQYIATGSLIFVSGSSYDGKLRCFRVAGGNTPYWTINECGDEISQVQFSRNGRIIAASCYGDIANDKHDLYIVKNLSTPFLMFTLKSPGSFFNVGMSGDGTTVVADGKAVHARVMGSGGLLYNIQIDTSENPSDVRNISSTNPAGFKLYQNYPNPFNPYTIIKFDVFKSEHIIIKIYDMLGKEVMELVNNNYQPGTYSAAFDAGNLSSGMYIAKIYAGNYSETIKMNLIK